MYARFVKLTFMNDFSKDAASGLLVELGKTKGFNIIKPITVNNLSSN